MRIAILDDDREEIGKLCEMVFHISGNYRVDRFTEGKDLLKAVESGEVYDLLLCDIYMQEENGIEIAKQMKLICPQTPVAFITSSREHAVDAFSVDAVHYLIKPVSQEEIVEVFRRLQTKTEPRHTLTVRIDRVINVLYQDEIIRIEGHGHKTEIICSDKTVYSIRKAFREIDELLDDTFIQIKKGITLNMRHILKMTSKECMSRDGKIYLLRRDQAKEIRAKFYAFVKSDLTGR